MAGLVATLAVASTALAGDDLIRWADFTISGAAIYSPWTVEAVTIGRLPGGSDLWVARRVTTITDSGNRKTVTTRWADSATCPSLIPTLAKLADLESLSIQPPGVPYPKGRLTQRLPPEERDQLIYDAGTCELSAPGHFAQSRWQGDVTLRGSAGAPVCVWAGEAMKAWEPCWKDRRP